MGRELVDRIILSTNDFPFYRDFWPTAARAWKALFPSVIVTAAFLTERAESDPIVSDMRKYGNVVLFKPIPGIPEFNLAKVIRLILAARMDGVCMVNDIDLIPLQRDFVDFLMSQRKEGELLLVGNKEFRDVGSSKAMMGYATAESKVWAKLLNPDGLIYKDLVHSWVGLKVYDNQEDISINVGPSGAGYPGVPSASQHHRNFSDESLLRVLADRWGGPIRHVPRGWPLRTVGYVPEPDQRAILDRASWLVDRDKLWRGEYAQAHLPRPVDKRSSVVLEYISYLEKQNG